MKARNDLRDATGAVFALAADFGMGRLLLRQRFALLGEAGFQGCDALAALDRVGQGCEIIAGFGKLR